MSIREEDWSYMSQKTDQMIREFNVAKEKIIKEALKKKNIELNWDLEKSRRFKSICIEKQVDEETWFYNDGSVDGLRIVTFRDRPVDTKDSDNPFSVKLEQDYYY